MLETTPDGNCFFNALQQMLPQLRSEEIGDIRGEIVEHIEGKKVITKAISVHPETIEVYCKRMRLTELLKVNLQIVFGPMSCALNAASAVYKIEIQVIRWDGSDPAPYGEGNSKGKIVLRYTGDHYYGSISLSDHSMREDLRKLDYDVLETKADNNSFFDALRLTLELDKTVDNIRFDLQKYIINNPQLYKKIEIDFLDISSYDEWHWPVFIIAASSRYNKNIEIVGFALDSSKSEAQVGNDGSNKSASIPAGTRTVKILGYNGRQFFGTRARPTIFGKCYNEEEAKSICEEILKEGLDNEDEDEDEDEDAKAKALFVVEYLRQKNMMDEERKRSLLRLSIKRKKFVYAFDLKKEMELQGFDCNEQEEEMRKGLKEDIENSIWS